MCDYSDDHFEWDEAKSADRFRRSGFDFRAAVRIFATDRYVERLDENHGDGEPRWIATGLLEDFCISVVYVERNGRKRIISAFEAAHVDILDFMVTYAIEE